MFRGLKKKSRNKRAVRRKNLRLNKNLVKMRCGVDGAEVYRSRIHSEEYL